MYVDVFIRMMSHYSSMNFGQLWKREDIKLKTSALSGLVAVFLTKTNFQRNWNWVLKVWTLFKINWILLISFDLVINYSYVDKSIYIKIWERLGLETWVHLLGLYYGFTKFSCRFFYKYKVWNYHLASVKMPNLV